MCLWERSLKEAATRKTLYLYPAFCPIIGPRNGQYFMKISKVFASVALAVMAFVMNAPAPVHAQAEGAVTVKVGGYPFAPFVDDAGGITPAFLTLLNDYQQSIRFEFVPIPSQRRYELMRREVIDAVFFEMPVWGWHDFEDDIEVSKPILRGSEIFVARRSASGSDTSFDLAPDRKVAVTLGYHYAFADFDADQEHIRTKIDAIFVEKVSQTLQYLRAGAVDMAVMSDIFLFGQYQRDPALQNSLVVGSKPDHDYALPVLIHKTAPVSAIEVDKLIASLAASGKLKEFFSTYGIDGLIIAP